MPSIVMVLIGFGAGMLTMTVMSMYKWVLEYMNSGV